MVMDITNRITPTSRNTSTCLSHHTSHQDILCLYSLPDVQLSLPHEYYTLVILLLPLLNTLSTYLMTHSLLFYQERNIPLIPPTTTTHLIQKTKTVKSIIQTININLHHHHRLPNNIIMKKNHRFCFMSIKSNLNNNSHHLSNTFKVNHPHSFLAIK